MNLTFEQAFAAAPTNGWLSEDEARLLWEAATQPETMGVLEIGTYFGRSAAIFGAALDGKRDASLVLCDPYCDGHHFLATRQHEADEARLSVVKAMERFKVSWRFEIKPDAELFAERRPERFDLLYLDGDHTYEATRLSLESWAQRLRAGGRVFVHDYAEDGGGAEVKRAIEDAGWDVKQRAGRMVEITRRKAA